jgi:hypothetical protein
VDRVKRRSALLRSRRIASRAPERRRTRSSAASASAAGSRGTAGTLRAVQSRPRRRPDCGIPTWGWTVEGRRRLDHDRVHPRAARALDHLVPVQRRYTVSVVLDIDAEVGSLSTHLCRRC